jgi:antitoxin component YwqK of YwqJK toxin-antitoxin module
MKGGIPAGVPNALLAGCLLFESLLVLGCAHDLYSARTLYSNGKVKETYHYRLIPREGKAPDTLLMGEHIQWDSTTGRKLYMTNYRDGKKDGVAIDWYPSGTERYRCHYRSGIPDSCSLWNEKGRLLERTHFHPDHGDTVFRYEEDGSYRILIPPGPID